MKLRYRILIGLSSLLLLSVVSLAVAVSYDSGCGTSSPLPAGAERMRAIVYRCYGPPEVLQMEQVAKPVPHDDQVLVRVHASSVNPADWYRMTGRPYVMRLPDGLGSPGEARPGIDFAGTVEAVGKNVTRFKPGDAVFGGRLGALSEFVTVKESGAIALKPHNVSFAEAAGVAVAAHTALQALRDQAGVRPGQRVLINGASGGVGTFAVQLAKIMGAEVTGVCSTRNVDLVRSIGADHVVDYTRDDFTQGDGMYDVIIDNVGNHSLTALRRVLKDDGTLVIVGGSKSNPWLGPIAHVASTIVLSKFGTERVTFFVADLNGRDTDYLAQLMRDGKLKTVIDRQYAFEEAAAAMAHLETGRARGKIIVAVAEGGRL